MQMHKVLGIAGAISYTLAANAPAPAQSVQNVTAVSGIVTGKVQEVGFRAFIQKRAIEYNLAGSVENNKEDKSVRFNLQGDKDRIDQALEGIRKGPKKSSSVNVSVSPVPAKGGLNTFTVVGWTSKSRGIQNPYNLIFNLRRDNTTIKKREAKKVWLDVCTVALKGSVDSGKCNKDDDEEDGE
jgi:acylphosphatase